MPQMELTFTDCSQCRECPLWESAKNPGIPTRVFEVSGKDTALLIVGEAPGFNEDNYTDEFGTKGKSWIGWSGKLLEQFIRASEFTASADVFLSNACRCHPPQAANVSNGQVGKCRGNLIADIGILQSVYKRVIILACGKPAAVSISGIKSLTQAFHHQGIEGMTLSQPPQNPPILFFTYHPAILHPKRKPALVHAVQAHFNLVSRYLKGEFIPNKLQALPEIGTDPDTLQLPNRIGLDIETYGILKNREQTVFHPVQSKYVDGVDFKDQIVTVAIGYIENGRKRTHQYIWENPEHRKFIAKWFEKIVKSKAIVLGQNIKFDMLYLSYADATLQYWISPQWLKLDDTMIKSFLYNDQQPEKGLKELTTLYGIADYGDLKKLYDENRAEDAYDPRLHKLNSLDVAADLTLDEELDKMILTKYGKKTPKLTQASADMRNAVIWCCLEMERVGCAMDRNILQAKHEEAEWVCAGCENLLRDKGVIPEGKGSDSSKRELIGAGIQASGLEGDRRVEFTPKTRKLAFGQVNTNLVLEYMPDDHLLRPVIETFRKLEEWSKVIETYTGPLLHNKKKGLVINDTNGKTNNGTGRILLCKGIERSVGVAYPSWYPVPSYSGKNEGGQEKTGGTIQARITCKRPPLQTAPADIYNAITTRFSPGVLRCYDFSQIEIRVAALLSGDPILLHAYQNGIDVHTQTARVLFPDLVRTDAEWKGTEERQLGKTINFLVLYKGGAEALQGTALKDLKLSLDIGFCADLIQKWWRSHPVLAMWQDRLVDFVKLKGYLELPTGWSRTFTTDPAAISFAVNEICNFPIQATAAQLAESSQFEILLRLRERNLRTIIPLQTYDSVLLDGPPDEVDEVDAIVEKALKRPPLLGIIEQACGRSVPIEFERKEICRYGC